MLSTMAASLTFDPWVPGGYLAYLLAANERNRWSGPSGPRCVPSIYGIPSFSHPFFNSSSQIPKHPAPVEGLAPFLSPTAPVSTGSQDTIQAMIPSYSEDGRIIDAANLSGIDLRSFCQREYFSRHFWWQSYTGPAVVDGSSFPSHRDHPRG